jgi:protein CpxP
MAISKITKGALVALFIMGTACTAMAQQQMQQRTPEERAQRQTQMMQQKLGLTADQTQKVHDILLYYAGQADNTKANASQGNRVPGAQQDIKRNKDADLQGVLTGAQYQQYQQMMQQRKEQMQQRRNGGMQEGGN